MEPFRLTNDPPQPEGEVFDLPPKQRQGVLFAGLDCLAGQQDLFDTDGEAE